VLLSVFWALFAWPVWKSKTTRDPLHDFFTDHQRYRYCSALIVDAPVRALTTPLGTLYAEDHRRHRMLSWEHEPCNQAGIVYVAVHAPFQWLLDAELISEVRATTVYVLLVLILVHVATGRLLVSEFWWAGALVYPFLLCCGLNGLQEPIPFTLALFAAFRWADCRRLSALALLTLAFSAYSRWVVWLAGFAVLCWRERRALREDLRQTSVPGLVLLLGLVLTAGWSFIGSLLVASAWKLPESVLARGQVVVLVVYAACLLVHWYRERSSRFAPVMLAATGFLVTYRGGMPYWYMAPLLPTIALGRGVAERWLWYVAAVAFPIFIFGMREWLPAIGEFLRRGWLG
jgi:hypothetical protein